jgi:transposase
MSSAIWNSISSQSDMEHLLKIFSHFHNGCLHEAHKFLDEWCRQTMRSRIEPMKKIARSLRQHRELILNYFRAQKL